MVYHSSQEHATADPSWLQFIQTIPAIFIMHFWCVLILIFPLFYVYGNIYFQILCTALLVYQYSPFDKERNRYYRKFMESCNSRNYFKNYDFIIEDPELAQYQQTNKNRILHISKFRFQELKNRILCLHPHGIFCYGLGMSSIDQRNKITYQMAGVATRITTMMPFSGLIQIFHGVFGANNKQFINLMKKGISFMMYPGGFEEASLTRHTQNRVYIQKRKGFIKYAIQNNYSIHPCYQFGETSLYYTLQNDQVGKILATLKLVSIIPFSRFLLFPISSAQMILVIGRKIKYQVKDSSKPTVEEIDSIHSSYVQELERIYNKYKDQYADGKQLEIY